MTPLADGANAFELKRQGHFEQSLQAYSDFYADALGQQNAYISQLCFDQMFDIELLRLARDEVIFESAASLRSKIQHHLSDLLKAREALDEELFQQHFADAWRKFSPRGRGRSQFSVGRDAFARSMGAGAREID